MIYKLTLQNHVDGLAANSWNLTPPATVGREPNAEVCIDHDSISRKHCQFSLSGEGALVVKDLGSTNGTYVDDNRVQHAVLMPGQIVQIGALRLAVDFDTDDDSAPDHPSNKSNTKSKGSVYETQPMQTFQAVPLVEEKPWWRRILG